MRKQKTFKNKYAPAPSSAVVGFQILYVVRSVQDVLPPSKFIIFHRFMETSEKKEGTNYSAAVAAAAVVALVHKPNKNTTTGKKNNEINKKGR